MRIISKRTLIDFWTNTPEAKTALSAWHEEVSKVTWLTTQCIKNNHRSASFLAGNRVVFNICGNKYRLVVKINYATKIVYIRFIGTHAQYDKINAEVI
jgi:mRNA interferase HigB